MLFYNNYQVTLQDTAWTAEAQHITAFPGFTSGKGLLVFLTIMGVLVQNTAQTRIRQVIRRRLFQPAASKKLHAFACKQAQKAVQVRVKQPHQ